MNIKPIRNDDDLKVAFQRLELVFQAPDGSPEADEMEVLVTLIEAYERKHYPICPADPIDAIQFRMEQQGSPPKTWRLSLAPVVMCPRCSTANAD
jgi:HTH-type transcriptional regulator/antitoxin HigA